MIEFRGVSKRYGALVALTDISFTSHVGRVTGLVGPNAAGKSTLLKLVVGFARPTSGTVLVDGSPPTSQREISRRVGILMANSGIPSQAPVSFYLRETARCVGADRRTLEETGELFGLAPVLGQRFSKLSLGSQRRVMLALAFLPSPSVLVLDEPLNGLDPNTARALTTLLREWADANNTCILFASHVVSELAHISDDLIVLGSGRILYEGTAAGLVAGNTATRVRVALDDRLRLQSLLDVAGYVYQNSGEDLLLEHMPCAEISRLCTNNALVIEHLSMEEQSLEEAYFELTSAHTSLRSSAST